MIGFRVRTSAGEWSTLSGYLDSGADISVFPASDIELLDISSTELAEVEFTTASGDEARGQLATVQLQIAGVDMAVPAVFSEEAERILERAGVFDAFYIVFDEAGRKVHLFGRDDADLARVLGS